MIADEAKTALGVKAGAVEGDDARRLLSAMLKRVQAEGGARPRRRDGRKSRRRRNIRAGGPRRNRLRTALFVVDLAIWRTLHRESPLVARLRAPCASSGLGRRLRAGKQRVRLILRAGLGPGGLSRRCVLRGSLRLLVRGRLVVVALAFGRRLLVDRRALLGLQIGDAARRRPAGRDRAAYRRRPRESASFARFSPIRAGSPRARASHRKQRRRSRASKPRTAPKMNPSVRSSAPIFESRMRSDTLTVTIETTIKATKNTAAMATRLGDILLGHMGANIGERKRMKIIRCRAGRDPRENRQHFARKSSQQGQHRGNQDDGEHCQDRDKTAFQGLPCNRPASQALARALQPAKRGRAPPPGKLEFSDKRRHRAYPRSVSVRPAAQ